ncbi:hypothetical protein PSE10C_51610 [Pseudomonas amygdali pv. eriobotryae]|nr:hypothetical protein PSE10C_51610 [Pseudomonas amygdali pv. eriobotryae]
MPTVILDSYSVVRKFAQRVTHLFKHGLWDMPCVADLDVDRLRCARQDFEHWVVDLKAIAILHQHVVTDVLDGCSVKLFDRLVGLDLVFERRSTCS